MKRRLSWRPSRDTELSRSVRNLARKEILETYAESELGGGSVFTVSLPLPLAVEPVSEPLQAVPRVPASLNVLVAEDDIVNQKVAAELLRRQGWTVSVTGTGEQAVEASLTERFDLILMDVQLPGPDGLEASTRIRQIEQQRSLAKTPIVAVTPHASSQQHDDCLAHGMDAVVTKPIDIAALLEAIQHVLPVTESVRR